MTFLKRLALMLAVPRIVAGGRARAGRRRRVDFRYRQGHVRRGAARRHGRSGEPGADRKGPVRVDRRRGPIQDRESSARASIRSRSRWPASTPSSATGIELAGTFVATVNAELTVGNVSETITVTAESRRSWTSRARSGSASSARTSSTRFRPAAATSTRSSSCRVSTAAQPGRGAPRRTSAARTTCRTPRSPSTAAARATRACSSTASGSATCCRRASSPTSCPTPARRRKSTVDYAAISAEQAFGGLRINLVPKEGGNTLPGIGLRHRRELRRGRPTTSRRI